MSSLSIRNIRKVYTNGAEVLKGIDIEIKDGQFLILVGGSGSGKSTLLNMIAGLESVTSGEIMIDNKVVNDLPPKDRDIAMVFQSYALYPSMTVRENIAFGLNVKKVAKAEQEEIVNRVAETLQISHLLDRRPAQLSGGQRQRVAMGRAISRKPSLFLFDEPLSNLDAKLRVEMRAEIKRLHQRLKATIVYVTHDQIEAMTMGDKIVVMRDGRIEQTGSPLDLYDRPANQFVAGFIGSPSMNFLPGTLIRTGGLAQAQVQLTDGTLLDAPLQAGGRDGQAVVYGTRPEHLTLSDHGGIPAKVVVMEPTGMDTFVSCRHGSTELCAVFRERHDFAPGSTVHLQPDLQRAHLFDAATGQRLLAST